MALDDKGYRVFNDDSAAYGAPLVWHCRDHLYCEGERLDAGHMKELQQLSTLYGDGSNVAPPLCAAGSKNGYLALGEDDWGLDETLHMCGYGDRTSQPAVCKKLPAKPAFGNPSGWFFNTTCKYNGREDRECGHSGWFQEGGYISSCTTAADCAGHDTESILDLFVNLDHDGSVSFTYTAHGEEFFDYMTFMVNDDLVHHTQTFWSMGVAQRRFGMLLPAGEHKLSWKWVKDFSVSENDDRATIHQAMCVCVCVCVYIYIDTYTYIHTHLHIKGLHIKDFSVSENDDRATIHHTHTHTITFENAWQLLITGTAHDTQCTPCPPGTCGNGGVMGCRPGFSKVLSMVLLYSKHTRALTFQNAVCAPNLRPTPRLGRSSVRRVRANLAIVRGVAPPSGRCWATLERQRRVCGSATKPIQSRALWPVHVRQTLAVPRWVRASCLRLTRSRTGVRRQRWKCSRTA